MFYSIQWDTLSSHQQISDKCFRERSSINMPTSIGVSYPERRHEESLPAGQCWVEKKTVTTGVDRTAPGKKCIYCILLVRIDLLYWGIIYTQFSCLFWLTFESCYLNLRFFFFLTNILVCLLFVSYFCLSVCLIFVLLYLTLAAYVVICYPSDLTGSTCCSFAQDRQQRQGFKDAPVPEKIGMVLPLMLFLGNPRNKI